MKRRQQENSAAAGEKAEIIDSDDQDQIICRISKEMEEQQKGINQAFRALCTGSAILSVVTLCFLAMRDSLMQSGRLSRWVHALMTAALHLTTPLVALPSTPTALLKWILVLPWIITILLGFSCLFHVRSVKGEDTTITVTYHQGLLLSNFLTTLAALWLRSDSVSIQISVDQLKEARYRHKSL